MDTALLHCLLSCSGLKTPLNPEVMQAAALVKEKGLQLVLKWCSCAGRTQVDC